MKKIRVIFHPSVKNSISINVTFQTKQKLTRLLHEMGTILLEEQEGEVKRKFAAIMSKLILKGEEVKYMDLTK